MTKFKDIVFGFDRIANNKDIASDISIINTVNPSKSQICMESVSDLDNSGTKAREWFLKGLDAEKGRALLKGEAYLEFWILAVDHNMVSANKRKYPYEPFKAALEARNVQNQLNIGGIPSEAEHPMLQMYSEREDSFMNTYNNVMRVTRNERNNCTHWIVGYKCTPEKTYLKVRTNPQNPIIVSDLLAKKIPAFSIRTKGDFNFENGVQVATNLTFLGADYVANPAFSEALALPEVKFIDPLAMKEFDMSLVSGNGMAAESEDNPFGGHVQDGDKVYYDESLAPAERLANMIIRRPIKEEKKRSFEEEFDLLSKSFL